MTTATTPPMGAGKRTKTIKRTSAMTRTRTQTMMRTRVITRAEDGDDDEDKNVARV